MATKAAKAPVIEAHVWAWEGMDRRGARVKGESRAPNEATVRAELRRMGINPIKIQKKSQLFSRKKRILPKDIAYFARQLSTMMNAGVPLVQAFDIIGRGHENPSMQELLLAVKNDLEGGTALAEALKKHPLYFDDLFCNLVRAGEQAGVLETVLDKIATYKERTESIKGRIKKALFYPAAVIVVAVVVTAVIMIFVIPQFQELFSSFGTDLPAFTQVVMKISNFVQNWWWAMLIGFAGFVLAFGAAWKRSPKLRELTERTLYKIPVIGVILHKAAVARFARTTSTMFAAGVPLVEALQSVAGATGSVIYGNAVLRVRELVATGQSMQLAMKQQNLFPHMVIQMVAIGEESGSLDSMLAKVADFFEEEVDNLVDALSSLIEPIIMVVLGVLIGGLVIAMYLPIFQLGAVVLGKK
jgi:type IV pilus assembly protein PilC